MSAPGNLVTDFQPEIVLDFWLGHAKQGGKALKEQQQRWFQAGKQLDDVVIERFSGLPEGLQNQPDLCRRDLPHRLASILVFDQFTRHLYRGQARAFAFDVLAQQLTLELLDSELWSSLHPVEASFCLMPLEHSENVELHQRCLREFQVLLHNTSEPDWQALLAGFYQFAQLHFDIIQRFGRYPHRNQILGRHSTAEEEQFLKDGGPRFGQ